MNGENPDVAAQIAEEKLFICICQDGTEPGVSGWDIVWKELDTSWPLPE